MILGENGEIRGMKKFFRVLYILSIISLSSCSNAEDDMYYVNKMVQRLEEASIWMVEEGFQVYLNEGAQPLYRKMIDDWAVQLSGTPLVDDGRFLAYSIITARGVNFYIMCLFREEASTVREYWIIKKAPVPGVEFKKRCSFLITTADSMESSRKILFQSDQFIEKFEFTDGSSIELPLDDNRLLYDLGAWRFPDSYPDSELKKIKIIIVDGEYIRASS